jgi:hypothetical protein
MIRHKLSNKTKSVTVTEPKHFHQLNKPYNLFLYRSAGAARPIMSVHHGPGQQIMQVLITDTKQIILWDRVAVAWAMGRGDPRHDPRESNIQLRCVVFSAGAGAADRSYPVGT